MKQLELFEVLTVVAILTGPIIALSIQRWLDKRRSNDHRRRSVFKDLMATRAMPETTSPRHVDALNSIEIEFSNRFGKDGKVRDAWQLYLDHLRQKYPQDQFPQWQTKSEELLIDLLSVMSKVLGYKYNKVFLKKNLYIPDAYIARLSEELEARQLVIECLKGKRPIWVGVLPGKDAPIEVKIKNPRPKDVAITDDDNSF